MIWKRENTFKCVCMYDLHSMCFSLYTLDFTGVFLCTTHLILLHTWWHFYSHKTNKYKIGAQDFLCTTFFFGMCFFFYFHLVCVCVCFSLLFRVVMKFLFLLRILFSHINTFIQIYAREQKHWMNTVSAGLL